MKKVSTKLFIKGYQAYQSSKGNSRIQKKCYAWINKKNAKSNKKTQKKIDKYGKFAALGGILFEN